MSPEDSNKLAAELAQIKQTLAQRERDIRSLESTVASRDRTIAGLHQRIDQLTGQRNLAGGAAAVVGLGLLAAALSSDE